MAVPMITIYTVWIQQPCRYEGEHAPWLWDAIDEYTLEENDEALEEAVKRAEESKNGDVTVIEIQVPQDTIFDLCRKNPIVNGVVKR